jgi:hypothetical protein
MSKQHAPPKACPIPPPIETDEVAVDDTTDSDTPPDGEYGWVCVAACFTINCFTWGAISVSLLPRSSFKGFSRFLMAHHIVLTNPSIGLRNLSFPLPIRQHLPRGIVMGLRLHRRSQLRHRYAARALHHRPLSKPRHPSHHAHRPYSPTVRFPWRVILHPYLAPAHLPRRVDRRWDRLLIHSLPACTKSMV